MWKQQWLISGHLGVCVRDQDQSNLKLPLKTRILLWVPLKDTYQYDLSGGCWTVLSEPVGDVMGSQTIKRFADYQQDFEVDSALYWELVWFVCFCLLV